MFPAACRTVTEVVGGAAGVVGWATSGLTARITHSTAPAVAKAVVCGDLISVEIKLLSSRDHRIQVVGSDGLCQSRTFARRI